MTIKKRKKNNGTKKKILNATKILNTNPIEMVAVLPKYQATNVHLERDKECVHKKKKETKN